jgi:hypothetical protein
LVAFVMSLAIAGAYSVREALVGLMAQHQTLAGAFVLYASFNVICASVAAVCVVYGAQRASGSGLPVRSPIQQSVRKRPPTTLRSSAQHSQEYTNSCCN